MNIYIFISKNRQMAKILVTGGCGYIGSHTIVDLLEQGHECVSIDNYLNSDPQVLDQIEAITGKKVVNHPVDLCDKEGLMAVMKAEAFDGIIHFAALKAVGESVERPLLYYQNNIVGMINLLDCALRYQVNNIIFSSSCTVYGSTTDLPVTEQTAMSKAESPYGYTKQVCERIIEDTVLNTELKAVILRYFNPAGAHESIELGESPINPPLNLVPVITEVGIERRDQLKVFGADYATRDGSCIRDYIHVMDLATAHTKSFEYLCSDKLDAGETEVFNLGSGEGTTVLEAIKAWEKVSQRNLNYDIVDRRPGDVEAIYANYQKAQQALHWEPKRNIEDIMKTAWAWEQKRTV